MRDVNHAQRIYKDIKEQSYLNYEGCKPLPRYCSPRGCCLSYLNYEGCKLNKYYIASFSYFCLI